MEMVITKEVFKAQAKKQHAALKDRSVDVKLSDIQESLAIAYGYANLATLYAVFKSEECFEVDTASMRNQKDNQFVITWIPNPDDYQGDDVIAVMPPGDTLENFNARKMSYKEMDEALASALPIPDGLVFSEETVVLESFAWAPRVSRYGFPDSANESTVAQWVKDWLGFRVPKTGVECNVYDLGDDSAGRDHFLLWLNDEDSATVRALFNK